MEEAGPLFIVMGQEKQEIGLSDPLDRGDNEMAAGRELGQILDLLSCFRL